MARISFSKSAVKGVTSKADAELVMSQKIGSKIKPEKIGEHTYRTRDPLREDDVKRLAAWNTKMYGQVRRRVMREAAKASEAHPSPAFRVRLKPNGRRGWRKSSKSEAEVAAELQAKCGVNPDAITYDEVEAPA